MMTIPVILLQNEQNYTGRYCFGIGNNNSRILRPPLKTPERSPDPIAISVPQKKTAVTFFFGDLQSFFFRAFFTPLLFYNSLYRSLHNSC